MEFIEISYVRIGLMKREILSPSMTADKVVFRYVALGGTLWQKRASVYWPIVMGRNDERNR